MFNTAVLINSRDQHEKHGVPLLRASITRLTTYSTQNNQLKCIGNNTVPSLNAMKILIMQSVENLKDSKSTSILSDCQPACRKPTNTRSMAPDFSHNKGNRI